MYEPDHNTQVAQYDVTPIAETNAYFLPIMYLVAIIVVQIEANYYNSSRRIAFVDVCKVEAILSRTSCPKQRNH